ncbi:MAG: hypothetical protein J7559_15900 [Cohnella sp.]|nr:hypothetical protein [Cohnella sp.]
MEVRIGAAYIQIAAKVRNHLVHQFDVVLDLDENFVVGGIFVLDHELLRIQEHNKGERNNSHQDGGAGELDRL